VRRTNEDKQNWAQLNEKEEVEKNLKKKSEPQGLDA
jgi:hypothetical protein